MHGKVASSVTDSPLYLTIHYCTLPWSMVKRLHKPSLMQALKRVQTCLLTPYFQNQFLPIHQFETKTNYSIHNDFKKIQLFFTINIENKMFSKYFQNNYMVFFKNWIFKDF